MSGACGASRAVRSLSLATTGPLAQGAVVGLRAAKPDRAASPGGRSIGIYAGRARTSRRAHRRSRARPSHLAVDRQVTVSSLESGHRLYSRPGVISAHVYGPGRHRCAERQVDLRESGAGRADRARRPEHPPAAGDASASPGHFAVEAGGQAVERGGGRALPRKVAPPSVDQLARHCVDRDPPGEQAPADEDERARLSPMDPSRRPHGGRAPRSGRAG